MTSDIQAPTPDTVNEAIRRYDEQHQLRESALETLFRLFPLNSDIDQVVIKIVAVNSLCGTCIFAIEDVARNIHRQHMALDAALALGDPSAVDLIARIRLDGKDHNFYSFATKYANCQQPDMYPVYDSRIDAYLWSLQQKTHFASYQHNDLCSYPKFAEIMKEFRKVHRLEEFSYKQIDKFLHQYSEPVVRSVSEDRQDGPGAFDFFPATEQAS